MCRIGNELETGIQFFCRPRNQMWCLSFALLSKIKGKITSNSVSHICWSVETWTNQLLKCIKIVSKGEILFWAVVLFVLFGVMLVRVMKTIMSLQTQAWLWLGLIRSLGRLTSMKQDILQIVLTLHYNQFKTLTDCWRSGIRA